MCLNFLLVLVLLRHAYQLYKPFKLNVAGIGCVCPQLHIHVLGRTEGDRAWPGPVWGAHPAEPYRCAPATQKWSEREWSGKTGGEEKWS